MLMWHRVYPSGEHALLRRGLARRWPRALEGVAAQRRVAELACAPDDHPQRRRQVAPEQLPLGAKLYKGHQLRQCVVVIDDPLQVGGALVATVVGEPAHVVSLRVAQP